MIVGPRVKRIQKSSEMTLETLLMEEAMMKENKILSF